MAVTFDKVVAAYVETRDAIDAIKQEANARIAELEQLQQKREQWLDQQLRGMEARGVKPSLRCDFGTVFYTKKESVRSADWETTLGYIIENQRWDLLTKALNKTVALEIMGEPRDITKLPGVNYTSFREVSVRRS